MVYLVLLNTRLFKAGFPLLLPFLFLSIHGHFAMSTNDYIDSRCSFNANDIAGGVFEANMKSVFSALIKDAPPVLFANTTAGQGSERVYGLAQCRGDIDPEECGMCISNSTTKIVDTHCPNAMDAIIWYEKCQLRYSNTSFFGRLNVEDSGYWYWANDKVGDPEGFNKKLSKFLKDLTDQAVTKPSRLIFATSNIRYRHLQTIYGLVQCTSDTNPANCSKCFNSTIFRIPTTCKNAHGCEIATGSCRVRFDTTLFYQNSDTPSPSSPPSGAPNITSG